MKLQTPVTFRLVAGRECIGPAWGAVVKNNSGVWGAACANTPAAAIEGGFIACRQKDPSGRGCDYSAKELPGAYGPSIALALSGSTPWHGKNHYSLDPMRGGYGSFTAHTDMEQYTRSPIDSMQQALSGFDKACNDGRPCYKTPSNLICIHETLQPAVVEKCMDRRLTRAGLSGSIRSGLR
ncbi:hypothetical protein D3C85_1282760 [compost metagenome]